MLKLEMKLMINLGLPDSLKDRRGKAGWSICIQYVSKLLHGHVFRSIMLHKTLIKDPDWPSGRAGVDYYFIQDNGGMFKATLLHEPYFYISCKVGFFRSLSRKPSLILS